MLNSEDHYQNSSTDFNEINQNIGNFDSINYYQQSKEPVEKNKLPQKTRLILFLVGFSYGGLFVISLIWGLIFSSFTLDSNFSTVLLETLSYASLLCALCYVGFKYRDYFFKELKKPGNYLMGIACGIGIIGAEVIVSYITTSLLNPETNNANQALVESLTTSYPTIMFIVTIIVGPFCEELTYRVGLYDFLRNKNETLGFIVSGLIFALVHISFTDTTFIAELASFPIYLTIAYLFNLTYKKYGLAGSYTAHMAINLISFILTIVPISA